MTHICVSKLIIIDSDNGLSPGRRQAIIWTNDGILSVGPLGTNFSEILFGIQAFSFNKMHLKMSSAKWRPFCLSLNVLMVWCQQVPSHFLSQMCLSSMTHLSVTVFREQLIKIKMDNIGIRNLRRNIVTVMSRGWASERLKSPTTPPFVQRLLQVYIKITPEADFAWQRAMKS